MKNQQTVAMDPRSPGHTTGARANGGKHEVTNADLYRAAWAASLGSALEYYDFALYNLALVTWLLAQNSALRMAMSLLVFGVLLAFLPLLGSGVKSQLAVLKDKAEPPARGYDAHAVVQLGVAVATVAVVTVVTGIPTIAF